MQSGEGNVGLEWVAGDVGADVVGEGIALVRHQALRALDSVHGFALIRGAAQEEAPLWLLGGVQGLALFHYLTLVLPLAVLELLDSP